jgi:hypothetical protein
VKLRGKGLLLAKPYLFYDGFGGTALQSGWVPTDTEAKGSVANSLRSFSGGKAAPSHGDPGDVWGTPFTRVAGRAFVARVRSAATNTNGPYLALSTVLAFNADTQREHALSLGGDGVISAITGATSLATPFTYSANTWYWLLIVPFAAGAILYASTDGVIFWPLRYETAGSTASLYLVGYSYNAACDLDLATVRMRSIPQPSYSVAVPASVSATELLSDPGLEATYTAGQCDTLDKIGTPLLVQSANVHGGSKAQQFTAIAQNDRVFEDYTGVNGRVYVVGMWGIRTVGAAGTTNLVFYDGGTLRTVGAITGAAYANQIAIWKAAATGLSMQCRDTGAGPLWDTVVIDDMSIKTLISCLGTSYTGDSQGHHYIEPTVTAGHWGGFCKVDSTSNPQNGIFAYVNQIDSKAYLDKIVTGVRSNLTSGAITYGAGKRIAWTQVGNSVQLYYDGLAVSTAQDVGATLGAYTTYCPLATDAATTFANFNGYGRVTL